MAVIASHRWLYELSPPARLFPSRSELLNSLVAKAEGMEHTVGSTWKHLLEASILEGKNMRFILLLLSKVIQRFIGLIYKAIVNNNKKRLSSNIKRSKRCNLHTSFGIFICMIIDIFRHYEEKLHETWMSSNVNPCKFVSSALAENKTLKSNKFQGKMDFIGNWIATFCYCWNA